MFDVNIFDALHRYAFDHPCNLDEESRQQLAEFAKQHGATEKEIEALLLGLIRMGMTFGHAHAVDATSIVVRALYAQGT